MIAAIRKFNEVIGLFDFLKTHNQFLNRLKLTLLTHPTLCLPVLLFRSQLRVSILNGRARRFINVTEIVHYFSFNLYVFCVCSFKYITKKLSVIHKSVDKSEINKFRFKIVTYSLFKLS
jgi:hypothetical protein